MSKGNNELDFLFGWNNELDLVWEYRCEWTGVEIKLLK